MKIDTFCQHSLVFRHIYVHFTQNKNYVLRIFFTYVFVTKECDIKGLWHIHFECYMGLYHILLGCITSYSGQMNDNIMSWSQISYNNNNHNNPQDPYSSGRLLGLFRDSGLGVPLAENGISSPCFTKRNEDKEIYCCQTPKYYLASQQSLRFTVSIIPYYNLG